MYFIHAMFLQILVQAIVLRFILFLVARFEADTSFTKIVMVTAGIGVGTFFIDVVTQHMHPAISISAQVTLITGIIMAFCWISWWKSLIVIGTYATCHFVFILIVIGLIMPGSAKEKMEKAAGLGEKRYTDAKTIKENYDRKHKTGPSPHEEMMAEAQAMAGEMHVKSKQRRRELTAEMIAMEEGYAGAYDRKAPAAATENKKLKSFVSQYKKKKQ